MQAALRIAETEETPEVYFDAVTGSLSLSGKSLPESAYSFYLPLVDWIKEYSKSPNENTVFTINLEYFNSGSLKQVFNLLFLVEEIMESGAGAKIVWEYRKGDELIQQKGLEFGNFLEVQVEMVEI